MILTRVSVVAVINICWKGGQSGNEGEKESAEGLPSESFQDAAINDRSRRTDRGRSLLGWLFSIRVFLVIVSFSPYCFVCF